LKANEFPRTFDGVSRPRPGIYFTHFFLRRFSRFFRGEKLTREYYIFKEFRDERGHRAGDALTGARKRRNSSKRRSGLLFYTHDDSVP